MTGIILLTGFEPFGGERSNPSWEVATRLDGQQINGAMVKSLRLPVSCRRAAKITFETIERLAPVAVVGLGQAGGRPTLSLEKVALNLADERASRERDGGMSGKPVVAGAPDAYFTRLPILPILRTLKQHDIPAGLSLSAGVYVCNTVMYAALHALRRRKRVPAGFIHLPYTASQAVRHRAVASMSVDTMTKGVEITLRTLARNL